MEKHGENSSMAMRLFATWDVDRATSSTVPRVFNLLINRIILDGVPPLLNSIIVTVKLPLSKKNRHLRSNEIKVTANHGRIDLDCDISFCIQYPHFLKRKSNILQLVIQRRRKYKNRLPGGFKDIAVGIINLSYVMQQGGIREICLNSADGEMELKGADVCSGRIIFASCSSQAPEYGDDRDKTKKVADYYEEDTESDYDDGPLDDLNDVTTRGSCHKTSEDLDNPRHRRRNNKNLKQKLVKLISRFGKMPVEEVVEAASTSGARPPTQKELEDLFEELSDFSDSGPEIINDDISICSNPRPCLQPFFTRSREVLPAIYDREADASESEMDREGWSSEAENSNENFLRNRLIQKDSFGPKERDNLQNVYKSSAQTISSFDGVSNIPQSSTINSISKNWDLQKSANVNEQISAILRTDVPQDGDVIWLCNLSEWSSFTALSNVIPILNCNSQIVIRQTISHIVTRLMNFCHTNSTNPPVTSVGIIGTDRLFSHTLKAYVECLAHRSSSNLLQYVQFLPVPSPNAHIYKLIEGTDPLLENLCRDIWDRFSEMNNAEKNQVAAKLVTWPSNNNAHRLNLPIGEAMLQQKPNRESDGATIFLPFLSELRVANPPPPTTIGADDDSAGTIGIPSQNPTAPREEIIGGAMKTSDGGSPPHSPHLKNVDGQELSMDFWVSTNTTGCGYASPNLENSITPNSKKDSSKVTIKAHFRTLLISRSLSSSSLTLTYFKEKKRDKMLQKLGMKKGQKQKMEGEGTLAQVQSIGRMLCCASGKNGEITILVDGISHPGIRYLQVSPQWQTHVKTFPILLLSLNT